MRMAPAQSVGTLVEDYLMLAEAHDVACSTSTRRRTGHFGPDHRALRTMHPFPIHRRCSLRISTQLLI
jgi:hypothetical protein